MALPVTDGRELVARGALCVELGSEDMPPFVAVPEWQPLFTKQSIRQFQGLEEADDVLVNSFHDLEPKVNLALSYASLLHIVKRLSEINHTHSGHNGS